MTEWADSVFFAWEVGFVAVCQARSEVRTRRVSTATGNRAQCCHGDTNDDCGKQRHVFEIKVVFVEVKVTPCPHTTPHPDPHPPPLLTGTATGSLLNPWAFVPSERPYSQGFPQGGFTRWDHWERTYKQSRRYKNAITSPGRQHVEIIKTGLTLTVTKAARVTQCRYIQLTSRLIQTHLTMHCVSHYVHMSSLLWSGLPKSSVADTTDTLLELF